MTANKIFMRNVRDLMEERHLTAREVCQAIGASEGAMSQWFSGATFPRKARQEAIADFFGTTVSALYGDEHIIVPVYGDIKAGYPALANEEVLDYEEIDSALARRGKIFGLRIKGDSMSPLFSEGDVALIQPQSDAEDGDYVVALVGEDATLKELQHNSRGVFLLPLNEAYSPLWYSNAQIESLPVIIIGKVVELRKKF